MTSKYFKKKCSKNSDKINKIDQYFFEQYSTIGLAQNLLGKLLCRLIDETLITGRIVETEAYLGGHVDAASYSYGNRRTPGNEPMYMEAGTCFVRLIYGMHYCLNLSSHEYGGAILIRAIEPIKGIEKMIELRMKHPRSSKKKNINFILKPHQIANGPAKLTMAYQIDSSFNKVDILNDDRIWLEHDEKFVVKPDDIIAKTRIGISKKNPSSMENWRFYLKENLSVSVF